MAMTSWMLKNRSIRMGGRPMRRRIDSEDDVQVDMSKDPLENARVILSNICKRDGLTEGKRFGYLSALVKLLSKVDVNSGELGYTPEQLQNFLRVAVIHEVSKIRAAAFRAVRYLLKNEQDVKNLKKLHYPFLIARSLDINLRNDVERVQALRLIRRMLVLAPSEFPSSLVRSLVSLANGGSEEKDRLLRSSLAVLAEICILNSKVFISCGGVSAVSRNILDCQMPRIAESLCGVLLFLLNNPSTRNQAGIRLQSLAAPYCDFQLDADKNRDERDTRFSCSKMALLSVLRSWPGLFHFCHPDDRTGLRAIVDIMYLKQLEVRKAVLDLLYDLLGLPVPEWTDEFTVALEAVDPSHTRDAWKLSEGFVAAEGKAILPNLAKFKPNLTEINLSFLLYTFLEVGMIEAIAEVIVSSDTFISVRATILLGVVLHYIHTLLPPGCCNITPALSNLLAYASNSNCRCSQQQALCAISGLARLHQMFKERPIPSSLFLDQLIQSCKAAQGEVKGRTKLQQNLLKDGDDVLRESGVLGKKDVSTWNWNTVRAILRSRNETLKKLEDSNHRTFLRRLVNYFKPSSNSFSREELGNKKQSHTYILAGCELIDCLLEADDPEGGKLLNDLLSDISSHIGAITSSKSAHDCLFSPQQVTNSLCQGYFLFIGRLCRSTKGVRALDKVGILQLLLNLVVSTNHDCYVKLVISSLDYNLDGIPRVILNKVLTAPNESSRLYATQFLLVLLRVRVPDFHKWGIEMLVMQLYDQSKAISLAAINILTEAVEEKLYLEAVIGLRPSLLHLGDRGLLLFVKFLSTPSGFTFLQDANFVSNQLERWASNYNCRYVRLVEGELHDCLTLHQRGDDGRYTRRLTNARHCIKDVFVPSHLYGQLAQHEKGFQMLQQDKHVRKLFQVIHLSKWHTDEDILELKAALWGCGHIATSAAGAGFLSDEGIVAGVIRLAETCPVYSVRGTAIYALGLIGTTFQGANDLNKLGWQCVRHHRHDRWPVIEVECDPSEIKTLSDLEDSHSFSSDWPTSGWGTDRVRTESSSGSQFYIPDDEDSIVSEEDEGMIEKSGFQTPWLKAGEKMNVEGIVPRKSQTLPYSKPNQLTSTPHKHFRSMSESKQPVNCDADIPAWTPEMNYRLKLPDSTNHSARQQSLNNIPRGEETKSRSNSCTDSSGVSSCDSGLGKHAVSERIPTLSPIPSSTSLNTLKSNTGRQRKSSQMSCSKPLVVGSLTSDGLGSSPDTNSSYLSQQDLVGYATLKSLNRYRRPKFSDTTALGAEELLKFENSRGLMMIKARSLDRKTHEPKECEFEASTPPHLESGPSSISLSTRTYYGSRSSIGLHGALGKEVDTSQQCYLGISLPRKLLSVFPQDGGPWKMSQRRKSASLSEIEPVVSEESSDESACSYSEVVDSPKIVRENDVDKFQHNAANCLLCTHIRNRKISTSSYRYHTDTESSCGGGGGGGGGESPVIFTKRKKSHSTCSGLLSANSGGSVGSSTSLEIGAQRIEEEILVSKSLIRKEILKHVSKMSNPVWTKSSKQALLQMKQKYSQAFQDICLYSEVCFQLGSCTYRLAARRFIQELFLDLKFDLLYEEPSNVIIDTQMQDTQLSVCSGMVESSSQALAMLDTLEFNTCTISGNNIKQETSNVHSVHPNVMCISDVAKASTVTPLDIVTEENVYKITNDKSKVPENVEPNVNMQSLPVSTKGKISESLISCVGNSRDNHQAQLTKTSSCVQDNVSDNNKTKCLVKINSCDEPEGKNFVIDSRTSMKGFTGISTSVATESDLVKNNSNVQHSEHSVVWTDDGSSVREMSSDCANIGVCRQRKLATAVAPNISSLSKSSINDPVTTSTFTISNLPTEDKKAKRDSHKS